MPLNITEKAEGKVIEIEVSGTLTRADFLKYAPEVERWAKSGKISILTIMRDFHGWDAGGMWEEIKWDFRHFRRVDRVALVGDRKWEARLAEVCKRFTAGEVRYFDLADLEEAREWVEFVEKPVAG